MASENFSKIYHEAMTQLAENTSQAWQSLLTVCIASARLATFESDYEPLKQVWTLPKACKPWQAKARILLSYLIGNGIPKTAKNGSVSYYVSKESIRIDRQGNVFLAENAQETYRQLIRKHDIKGERTPQKAIDLISTLHWQATEKAEKILNCQQVADLLQGLSVDDTCKARLENIIAQLRTE